MQVKKDKSIISGTQDTLSTSLITNATKAKKLQSKALSPSLALVDKIPIS